MATVGGVFIAAAIYLAMLGHPLAPALQGRTPDTPLDPRPASAEDGQPEDETLDVPDDSSDFQGLYPDLRTQPATDLLFDSAVVDGVPSHVLRFSVSIWNAGEGPLEVRGDSAAGATRVYQRIYDQAGDFREVLVGSFVFHEAHNHWHFENFALYELWSRPAYESWLASGRSGVVPMRTGSKTTGQGEGVCIRESVPVREGASQLRYTECGRDYQGIGVGWADIYPRDLPDQWVALGSSPLADGDYVLRLVADPLNFIYESDARADASRESPEANEAATAFRVVGGQLAEVRALGASGGDDWQRRPEV